MRRLIRFAAYLGIGAIFLAVAAAALLRAELRASLPDDSGELALAGLLAPVTVERDALGVVTIRSTSRVDEARALGFVHGQERFFQMDLLRRAAAGELAALVGEAALEIDRARRPHGLRDVVERALGNASPDYRAALEAYSAGVNQGLAALEARPFEYLLLRARPEPWSAVDSLLVGGAMYFDLQAGALEFDRNEIVARMILPEAVADLLYPEATPFDAPLVGAPGPAAEIPPATSYDLRRLPRALFTAPRGAPGELTLTETTPGSNHWAVAGGRTATGKALLASDPHLTLRVPAIWFRVSLERDGRRLTGASLPGVPSVVFGSNGDIAWGFTNAYGDWHDIVALELDESDASRYRTSDGWREIGTDVETILVAHGAPVDLEIRSTVFGPVIGTLPDGRPFAVRWVAHDPAAHESAGMLDALGRAGSLAEALPLAQGIGMPENNVAIADREGHVAWTIAGPLPRRRRPDGLSRSDEDPAWDGWLLPAEYPTVTDPAAGFVFTANARVVDGAALAAIGRGNFALGARAAQIRDRLAALGAATEADMLAIQLDDEARFLARWRDELLRLLDGESDALLVAAREAVVASSDRAAIDAVGYRILRGWRLAMIERMTAALAAEVVAADPAWIYASTQAEHWVWPLVADEPPHLLDPRFPGWQEFKLDVLRELLDDVLDVDSPRALEALRWGGHNTVTVRHPLSGALPLLPRWLDMPADELPGDILMPRVQAPGFGASARFAVSPGNEAAGYFHMPGGQSGHPLSPWYRAGHEDWARGRPTPFLPGPAERSLRLVPDPGAD
jgi:penicillin amidase